MTAGYAKDAAADDSSGSPANPIRYVDPFPDLFAATNWASRLGQDVIAECFPVVRPEDVPEGGLPDEPEEETGPSESTPALPGFEDQG